MPRAALMIDHHEVGVPFADNFIIGGASSAGEVVMQVAEELEKMGRITLEPKLAYPLYAAISSDTGCFRYSNATPDTMRRGATLIETGIDAEEINHRLFNSKSQRQIRAEGFVSEKIVTKYSGRVAYATVTRRERERLGVLMEHLETAIDVVRSVEMVEISFALKETDKGEFKASLRSTGADVATICARFGGGGHIKAAGCTVPGRSIEEATRKLLSEIGNTYYAGEEE